MTPLAWVGAAVIGLTLGLTGAGGSILTLPVLVYLAKVEAHQAIGMSLMIVGSTALVGAIQRARAGAVHYKAATIFAISGMAGTWWAADFSRKLPKEHLMLTFAIVMILVGLRMALSRSEEVKRAPECQPGRCFVAGAGVGLLTGLLGVGGGFLLMPALLRFAQLPLRVATGTSLAIIASNSAIGFVAHLSKESPDWMTAWIFCAVAIGGVVAGGKLASHLPEVLLRRTFGIFVLMTAAYVLWQR